MIEEFTKKWFAKNHMVREKFEAKFPESYDDIVKAVIDMLFDGEEFYGDPPRVHKIDDGHYQGTLVYVISEAGYQPHEYWYVRVYYGSCSGCDTLESLRSESCNWEDGWSEEVGAEQKKEGVDGLMTLALHIVQGLKEMKNDE
jgi:hypothetical protein